MKVNVRWHTVYYPEGVTGFTVYAWVGHPLLGEVVGTRQYVTTEYAAKKLVKQMRRQFSNGKGRL